MMKTLALRGVVSGTALVLLLAVACAAGDFHVIPFDVDPPVVVDGELDDWAGIPNALTMNEEQQVTYGPDLWTGPADLSAVIHLAWRPGGLYIAAEVNDDVLSQPYQGGDFWKGDHVVLFMDFTPQQEPTRTMFGGGQFQIGLSPGSFGAPGAGGEPTSAEMWVWRPTGLTQEGGEIISRKTENGYVLEAFVPFARLAVPAVKMNQDANFEIAISDSDAPEGKQETLITSGTTPWSYSRKRLLPVVFGDGNGRGTPPARTIPIAKAAIVPKGGKKTITFEADELPEGKMPYLFFKARLHRDRVAGFRSRSLKLLVNGQEVTAKALSNRPVRSMYMAGKEAVFVAPDGAMTIPYAPTPEAFDESPMYALVGGVKGCEFEFEIAGQFKPGENAITFDNLIAVTSEGNLDITIEDIALRIKAPAASGRELKPAPTGPLPVRVPRSAFPKTYDNLKVDTQAATVSFTAGGEQFAVTSRFSAPDGKWHPGRTGFYTHKREVIEHEEWIEVRDTFVNTSGEDVPVMQSHTMPLGDRMKDAYLSCVWMPSGQGQKSEPANPSVLGTTEKAGAGLLALNDVFRVHSVQTAAQGTLGLADRTFVLKKGAAYTAEMGIFPVDAPDLWRFINAARRAIDANFTLKHMFAFAFHREPVYEWSDKLLKDFVTWRGADFVAQSLYFAKYRGRVPQGVAFQMMPEKYDYYRDFGKRLETLFPENTPAHAVYFHCYLDIIEENAEKYADSRRIDAGGNHMTYGGSHPYLKLYVPTLDNAWGRDIAKGIDARLDTIGCDGIYWDEFNQSRGAYTYNMWDGCSGVIDGSTFKLIRKKGAVHLLSLPWLVTQAKRIMERGPLVLNGAPLSRTIAGLKIQNFVETGSITNCHRTILHSPIALGDHLTEKTFKDAYDVMHRALDWGCLYNWYSSTVLPSHPTIGQYMFPFTPIELHEGYIFGQERIITRVSGRFGWDDNSTFTIHVYDREGREAEGEEAKTITEDGKRYAEVRIPEGFMVAIVRDQAK